jgi:hypothetical protein
VAENSPASKQGSAVGVVASGLGSAIRVLGKSRKSGQLSRGLMSGSKAFLRVASRAIHQLWLEVTGFIFLCFATIGSFAAIREYRAFTAGTVPVSRAILAAVFALMFAYFGLSSFWRSRRRAS